jgi:peptidoglycan/LPS O-acetylase OafA/YrhL
VALVLRLRRSSGEERQQLKWVVYSVALLAFVIPSTILVIIILQSLEDVRIFFAVLFPFIPISVGIAILKYRLYDIDILINRTLVYGSLTAMLVLVYFGGVAATETLFRSLTGQQQQPQLAIVLSTLVIAALFNPLRHRIQSFIDRRFYRSKYDARKTLETFSARLRNETDLDALGYDLLRVVRETMQPAHTSLWLRQGGDASEKAKRW